MAYKPPFSNPLTPVQFNTLKVIAIFIRERGMAPLHAELAALLNMKARAIVNRLAVLETKGYLDRTPSQPRGIRPSAKAVKEFPELAIRLAS